MGSLHPSVCLKESTMRVLVHLVVAVLIYGCYALEDQPKGEIQQDGTPNRQLMPSEGKDNLESGLDGSGNVEVVSMRRLVVRSQEFRVKKCKATYGGYEIWCYGGCGQSHDWDNYDWCYTTRWQTLFNWDYCSC